MQTQRSDTTLAELEARLPAHHLRGQWQADPNRPQNVRRGSNGAISIDPAPAGKPHVWKWAELQPILAASCKAMPESYTARRALVLANPGLPRGTTHTLLASFQIIRPGEVAWAHRHTISAIRFAIKGSQKLTTVVESRSLPMEPYDLILTPSGSWHDHQNGGDSEAIWLDALDVPFTLALNQNFYDELGEASQEQRGGDLGLQILTREWPSEPDPYFRPFRYAWTDMQKALASRAAKAPDPHLGCVVEYVDPSTGSSVLPTLACSVRLLPPGFEGAWGRRTASLISLVIQGEGQLAFRDAELSWRKHDAMAVPNWAFHRWINGSKTEPAILFSITDAPILKAFGYYREEAGERA